MSNTKRSALIPAKILVPVDFSPSSHGALEQAAAYAQQFNAEVHLVHVIPMFPSTKVWDLIPEREFIEQTIKKAEASFAATGKDLAAMGIKTGSSVRVANDVVAAIIDVIKRERIGLLVVSTHGITGWHPLAFGSIAEKLVKLADIPVLLIRTPDPAKKDKARSGALKKRW
jgi:nucleotide-binding universal stress UspA family protein